MKADAGFFDRLMRDLSEFFGDMCEIVVHDYRMGADATVVDIINGDLSGRSVGDPARSALILGLGQNVNEFKPPAVFYFTNPKGLICKSCTTFIADENEKIIGAVCINLNMTDLIRGSNAVKKLLDIPQSSAIQGNTEDKNVLVNNVDDVLDYFLSAACREIGKMPKEMTKEEKIQALGYLDRRGILKISKASIALCQEFDISKYTLYNYIDEARNQFQSQKEPIKP